jgi:hypothetical protein
MTDDRGTFEHALLSEARHDHGYCTDDMARVLIVATREPQESAEAHYLLQVSLRFLTAAQSLDGGYHNRLAENGRWQDRPALEDAWGRSVWALGTAAAQAKLDWVRQTATYRFEAAARRRSPWLRATAYSVIGAAEVLSANKGHREATALLRDSLDCLPWRHVDEAWPWPEPRLTYANAVIPEAMIAVGHALDRSDVRNAGLVLLRWLVAHETGEGHLSVTPAGGSDPEAARPAFDQQPVEVAALTEACARAATVDPGEPLWATTIAAADAWFDGDNDGAHVMWDSATGGAFDGLEADGTNLNQGTESTLALISTRQHARRLTALSR